MALLLAFRSLLSMLEGGWSGTGLSGMGTSAATISFDLVGLVSIVPDDGALHLRFSYSGMQSHSPRRCFSPVVGNTCRLVVVIGIEVEKGGVACPASALGVFLPVVIGLHIP